MNDADDNPTGQGEMLLASAQSAIAQHLRRVFDPVQSEPIPPHLQGLLEQLGQVETSVTPPMNAVQKVAPATGPAPRQNFGMQGMRAGPGAQ